MNGTPGNGTTTQSSQFDWNSFSSGFLDFAKTGVTAWGAIETSKNAGKYGADSIIKAPTANLAVVGGVVLGGIVVVMMLIKR